MVENCIVFFTTCIAMQEVCVCVCQCVKDEKDFQASKQ